MVASKRSKLDPVVRRVLDEHGPLVRTTQFLDAGVPQRTLYGLRNAGQLEVVGRGMYRLPSAPLPDHLDLLVIAKRAPHAVICLVSALSFHGLTDKIPHEVSIAIPRNGGAPRIDTVPTRVFRYAEALYRLGVEHHREGNIDLKVYGAAKSIIDAFRFRNRIGEDVAIAALAAGLRSRKVRPGPLLELADKLRARNIMLPYVKALTL